MDIRQLELLVAVVDLSSVTKAAEQMHISPGATTEVASAQFLLYPKHSNMRAMIDGFLLA